VINGIIAEMGSIFGKDMFTKKTGFRFSLDDTTITVICDVQSYAVEGIYCREG